MKNLTKFFGVIALAAVIGFSVIACGDGGGGGDPLAAQLNGTYKAADGETITLNNGSFEITQDNKAFIKGTYTAAARSVSATISMAVKQLSGDFLNENLEESGLDIYTAGNWYNKTQVSAVLRQWMEEEGVPDADITDILDDLSSDFDAMYPTITGTIDGDTMTVGRDTYTKTGGSSNPGTNTGAPTITTTSLPDGAVGTPYSQTLSATGAAPITWSRDSGTLPTGLTLSPAGVISGTPTTAGLYTFTVKATNSAGSGTKSLSITITSGGTNPVNPGTGSPTWTAVDVSSIFGERSIKAIAYGNGTFVAGGYNGKMAYSTDGVTWTAVANSTFGTSSIYAIVYANNKFVAGGEGGRVAYSTDGETWTAVANSTFDGSHIYAIAYGGSKFVAVGSNGTIAYSSNGETWTAVANSTFGTSSSDSILAIAYGNNKFVAGCGSKTAYSTDGVTWTAGGSVFDGSNNLLSSSIIAIAYGNGKFVAVGNNGKMAYSSDGSSWTAVTDSKFGTDFFENGIRAIAYGGGKFVAGGEGKIAYSSNGESWTLVTPAALIHSSGAKEDIISIAWGNNKFVAGGESGKIVSSTDGGVTWKTVDPGRAFYVQDVQIPRVYALAYGNNKFVGGGVKGILAYSSGN